MIKRIYLLYSVILLYLVCLCTAQQILVAKYNMGGVTGNITFSQNSLTSDVDIVLKLIGLKNGYYYRLELHEFRVNYDTSDRCAISSIGNRLGDDITGITSGAGSLRANGFALSGTTSIEGRSFLLTNDDSLTVCATIESDEEYITAFAHFPANIGGTMIFRQRAADSSADTTIYYKLFHTVENKPTTALKWQINSGVVAMDINAHTSIANRCGTSVGDLYNPTSSAGSGCAVSSHVSCKVGDLSGKHGDITLNSVGNTRGFFPDLNLPLSGTNSVIGKTILFKFGDSNYACANIVEYPVMSAVSKFSNDGVTGLISFSQRSPYDVTTIRVNLQNLENQGGGYHVHKWPVPQKIEQSDMVCAPEDVSGHLNPFNIDINSPDYPAAGTGTPDQYEIGDISGKFGMLSNMASYDFTYRDPNLPLFGMNSIVGRSMVIHKDLPGGPRWICSTIWPSVKMTTAVAKFKYPVIGYMILRQAKDTWYAETQIYAELNYATEFYTQTRNHEWHIHQLEMGDDMLASKGRCSSVGGHYNPYNVSLVGDYPSACDPLNQLRCELGDLVGKHGPIDIRSATGGTQKYFFSDMHLPLSGPQSILGKSIVLHDANFGGGRLSCANVYEKQMRTAAVASWTSADPTASVSGNIEFSQDCTDTLAGISNIKVELAGLNGLAGGYHVHLFPTSGALIDQSQRCKDEDVGGHLNPFAAPYPRLVPGTQDQYEIGDLSGKHSFLTGSTYSTDVLDMNLPMEGPLSIVGRSIVIHKADAAASRWVCGTIEETTPGATKLMAKAVFNGENNGIHGTIYMAQYRYSNGDMSDTYFVVDVKYRNDTITNGHDWHVHENPITDNNCTTAGNHYNPYMVNMGSLYKTECSISNPLRCEVGDQSGKMGQYDIGGGKKFYTDVNVNLEGEFAVTKRSIVFHETNGGLPRIACADIIPFERQDNTIYVLRFLFVDHDVRSEVEKKVADSINAHEYNIQAVPLSSGLKCQAVTLYFLGPEAVKLRASFVDVINGEIFAKLRPFIPSSECVTACAGFLHISLMAVLLSTILPRLLKS